jgi:hypothetical protein
MHGVCADPAPVWAAIEDVGAAVLQARAQAERLQPGPCRPEALRSDSVLREGGTGLGVNTSAGFLTRGVDAVTCVGLRSGIC